MLKSDELKQFKIKLLKSRSVLQSGADHMESDVHYSGKNGVDNVTLNHMADAGSDTFEMEFSMEQIENKENILYEIDEALKKIDQKTFGICDLCSKKISKVRLQTIPFAKNCIACQEKEENESI
jgi:RNA polymerase-binding protein DksA